MTNHELKNLKEILDNEDQVKEIGSEILQRAILHSAGEQMGIRPENPSIERTISEGDPVPRDLRGTVQTNDEGFATGDWGQTWTDLGIWTESWSDTTQPSGLGQRRGIDLTRITPLSRHRYLNQLSNEEREILMDLDLMDDI